MKKIFIIIFISYVTFVFFSCKKSDLKSASEKQEEILTVAAQSVSWTETTDSVIQSDIKQNNTSTYAESVGATGYMGGTFHINDNNVRLRDNYGLDSNIIGKLNINDAVECSKYVELRDDSDFQWINVNTHLGRGWVYGEYIFKADITKYRFENIEEAGIKTENGLVLSGMKEAELVAVLGEPNSTFYDDIYNEDTFYYTGLTVMINRNFKRVQHIIIESSEYELANGIKVGDDINKLLNANEKVDELKSENRYSYQLKNFLRKAVFDANVVIRTDKNGLIKEFQIGFPD